MFKCMRCGKPLVDMNITNNARIPYWWCSKCNIDYYQTEYWHNRYSNKLVIEIVWSSNSEVNHE